MAFRKLSVDQVDVEGKRVLVRVDFNVPLEKGEISDDRRIRQSLPTVRHLLDRKARPILVSHLGRPKARPDPALKMDRVAVKTAELLGSPVDKAPGCIEPEVARMAKNLPEGRVLLLENVRFYPGEEKGDDEFAKQLAGLGELFVQDAFGTCHRSHASVVGVTHHLRASAGFLLKKELEYCGCLLESGETPFVCILGGAKSEDKIPVIEGLIGKADTFLVGGAMAYTFLAAKGVEIGASRVETDRLEVARDILKRVEETGTKFLLPTDHVVSRSIEDTANVQTVKSIPSGWMGLDIGPETAARYEQEVAKARMVVFNGPMGVFETPAFALGTKRIIRALAESEGVTVVGGGDSAHAVEMFGAADRVSHISTGGGAFLELLAYGTLPGLEALASAE